MEQPYVHFLETFAAALRSVRHAPAVRAFADELTAYSAFAPAHPAELPLVQQLPTLLQTVDDEALRPLTERIQALRGRLRWTRFYDESPLTASFLEQFAVAHILSPDGPMVSERAIVYLLLIGPNTLYPLHWHAAEELYFVLAGSPAYQIGGFQWRSHPPGDAVHVPPLVPHAIRTTDRPLLAVQVWRGDIEQPSLFPVDAQQRPAQIIPAEQRDD